MARRWSYGIHGEAWPCGRLLSLSRTASTHRPYLVGVCLIVDVARPKEVSQGRGAGRL
jgi:hypothetical protein